MAHSNSILPSSHTLMKGRSRPYRYGNMKLQLTVLVHPVVTSSRMRLTFSAPTMLRPSIK